MTEKKPSKKNLLEILSIALISFVGILMTTGVNVNFPMLTHYFHQPLSMIQWFSTAALIMSAITMLTSAYLDHRYTDQQVFISASVVLLISLLICTFATNYWFFLFGRLLDGYSIGTCTPLMFNVIPRIAPKRKIGFYMASGATIVATGPSLGPTYGGVVSSFCNWRMIFIIVMPIVLFLLILGMMTICNQVPLDHSRKLDLMGLAWIIVACFSLTIGFSNLAHFNWLVVLCFMLSIFAFVGFYRHSINNDQALLQVKILKRPDFRLYLLGYFLIQFTNIGYSGIVIPNFSQVALGTSAFMAGIVLLPGNLTRIFCMPYGGHLLDEFGAKRPIYIGLSCMGIYFLLMAVLSHWIAACELLITFIFFSMGLAFAFSNTLTQGLNSLPRSLKSDGNAFFNAVQVYGGAIGTCILSLIIMLTQIHTSVRIPRQIMRQGGFWCSSFTCLIILIAFLVIARAFKITKKLQK